MLYACPVCGHMPAEHGPEGCVAPVGYALVNSPNPAVRSGQVMPTAGRRCGCCAMVNGELARPVEPGATPRPPDTASPGESGQVAFRASSLPKQGGDVSDFDINAIAPPPARMDGNLAKQEAKNFLWVNKVPLEIHEVPQRRRKPASFMMARDDGTMPSEYQWWVPVRELQWRGDGSFGLRLQPDGEGGQEPVAHILTFDASDWRDGQFQNIANYVQQHGPAGPIKLTKGQNSGRGQAPWVFDNWRPNVDMAQSYGAQAPFAASVSTPAPAPAASTAPPPVDNWHYETHPVTGKKLRWKEGMVDWEEVPAAAPPPFVAAAPPPLPPSLPAEPVRHAQPIPATTIVQGMATSEGYQGHPVVVERADGSQMRQAVYQGDGVVAQPSGVDTLNATGVEPRTREEAGGMGSQTPVVTEGVSQPTESPFGPQAPSPGPTQAVAGTALQQAYQKRTPIQVDLICDHPGHVVAGQPAHVQTPAFYDPQGDKWVQTHNCPGHKRMHVLDATAAVRKLVGA